MIAAIESEDTKEIIRHQVSSLLMAHQPLEMLPKLESVALRALKSDRDIVIVLADKGRSTVVMDRTYSPQKTKNLVEDR
ncbi:unnamed protein product [Dibothriocephalus latus]|uniref:Uncharacterized protein n=1 Tax=Dibothriocephalus latus TaxID=60516 RepID=A0A3P7M3R7_DIBLA|nr:unnamed protein product [Dibothriocephalus latus]